jgi:signal transduction histidine kinase
MIYVLITFLALAFLNIYCSKANQRLHYESKKTAMLEKAQLAASEIGRLEVINAAGVEAVVKQLNSLKVTRMIITDQNAQVLYDSQSEPLPEKVLGERIPTAIEGNDVFEWQYHDSTMRSEAATPVLSDGIISGCVYVMEFDTQQGALIASQQKSILTITLVLEVIVIVFSLIFAGIFSMRLSKIANSMRILRNGDYDHRLYLPGKDELSFLADEVNDLTSRLQISENKRRQFVSDASHELKTPLATIKLLSDSILQNEMDEQTIREFVGDIGSEADRLNRMSEKLLDLTRGESIEADHSNEIIRMSPIIRRACHMLEPLAEQKHVQIHIQTEADPPVLIREDDLYQIAFNLVENGIKYNAECGKVTITLDRNEEFGTLLVEDTGIGIPEDALSHIFERFYRVDKARSRASGGSGLGLAIVRAIIRRNRGEIRVESELGKGTVFTVTFPSFETEVDRE